MVQSVIAPEGNTNIDQVVCIYFHNNMFYSYGTVTDSCSTFAVEGDCAGSAFGLQVKMCV